MACFRSLSNSFFTVMATLALIVLAAPSPARAAIDKAGAEKLKAVVEKAMEELGDSAEAAGKILQLDGPVMVEPSGTYYAVTLPGLKYGYMDGAKIEMGMIAINAMPAAKPGNWKMTVALPTPISHFDEEQQLSGLTTIGSQSFAGIWSEELDAFVKLNAAYQNVVRMNPEHKPIMTVKAVTITGDSTQNDKGAWSGGYVVEGSGIAYADDSLKTKGSIEKMTGRLGLKNYSAAAAADYDSKLAALSESYSAGEGEEVSLMHMLGLYNLFTDFVSSAWQGVDTELTMQGAAFSRPGKSGRPPQQMSIKDSRIGFGLDGIGTDKVTLGLRLGYDGLAYAPSPIAGDVVPDHMNMDISINNLPLIKLLDLGRESLQMTASMPSESVAKFAFMRAVMEAPGVLAQAGTNLTVRDTKIGNAGYDVSVAGVGIADLKALLSATGKATVKIRNIEVLAAGVKAAMDAPGTAENARANLQRTLQAVTVMQMAGRKEKNAAGENIHAFDVELARDGKILVNGADLSVLLPEEDKKAAPSPAAPVKPQ